MSDDEKQSGGADILGQVLQDSECRTLLVESLKTELKRGPLDFYKTFVARMKDAGVSIGHLTVVEEVRAMSAATAPKEKDATKPEND